MVGATTDIGKFQNRIQFGPPFCLSKNQQNFRIQHEWYNDTRSEISTVRSLSIEGSVNAAGELAKCVRVSSRTGAQMGQG